MVKSYGVETCSHPYGDVLLLSLSTRSFSLVGKGDPKTTTISTFSLEDSFMFQS